MGCIFSVVPPHKVLSVENGKIPIKRLMSRFKSLHTLYLHLAFGEAQLHFLVGILPSTNARPTKNVHADQYEFLRDLTPQNIFLNDNMEVKIGDFGLATQVSISVSIILIFDILSVCRLSTTVSERKSGVGRFATLHLRCLARKDTVMRLRLFMRILNESISCTSSDNFALCILFLGGCLEYWLHSLHPPSWQVSF